jgi:hypothetical protein
MLKRKKQIISLALVGLMLTTSSSHILVARSGVLNTIGSIIKPPLRVFNQFSKYFPAAAGIITALLFARLIKGPINRIFDEGIDRMSDEGFVGGIKWLIQEKDKNDKEKKRIKAEDAIIDFENTKHFAKGSIDKGIQELKEKINLWTKNPDTCPKPRMFMLLDGPTHIGKSRSALGLAKAMNAKKVFQIVASDLQGGIVGETQKIYIKYLMMQKTSNRYTPLRCYT